MAPSGAASGEGADAETVGHRIATIFPRKSWRQWGTWPPNVFAVAACLLSASGGYAGILHGWHDRTKWPKKAGDVGAKWISAFENGERPPKKVLDAWSIVQKHRSKPLSFIRSSGGKRLRHSLVELVAYADESCAGLGIPPTPGTAIDSQLELLGNYYLNEHGTATPDIPASILRVLGKQHTPTVGVTLRSLSHHLALVEGSEVSVEWHWMVQEERRKTFNILLVPWPNNTTTSDFKVRPTNPGCAKEFDYTPQEDVASLSDTVEKLLKKASRQRKHVDGIVFPESALSPAEFWALNDLARQQEAFLVAGVRDALTNRGVPVNIAAMSFFDDATKEMVTLLQAKHHRWRLEKSQIEQYGLEGVLDPKNAWWESTAVVEREVKFIFLESELAICCLICEDLARQDPIADVVRAVGPNLVIALLLDGPQIKTRWPARYATVLSDDPGSSVVTLSSRGMVKMSRPPVGTPRSKSIGLWRDALGGVEELTIPQSKNGVLLTLEATDVDEFTLDGRSDGGKTSYTRLKSKIYL